MQWRRVQADYCQEAGEVGTLLSVGGVVGVESCGGTSDPWLVMAARFKMCVARTEDVGFVTREAAAY